MSIDEMIAVLQAAKAGKQIQRQQLGAYGQKWVDAVPSWDFALFTYRVKPDPREWYAYVNTKGELIGGHGPSSGGLGEVLTYREIKVREVL